MSFFLLLLVVTMPAGAAQKPGPLCPDGSPASFSGHPMFPILCPNAMIDPPAGSGEVLLSTATLPLFKHEPYASFEPLLGRWEGWAIYGMSRFEVVASAERVKRRIVLKLSVMDHATLRKNRLKAALRKSFWHSGRYYTAVEYLDLPESALDAMAWLGAASPPIAQGLDRSFVLVYKRLASLHEVRFMLDGPGKIRFSYIHRETDAPPVQIDGTLTRSGRDPY